VAGLAGAEGVRESVKGFPEMESQERATQAARADLASQDLGVALGHCVSALGVPMACTPEETGVALSVHASAPAELLARALCLATGCLPGC